MIVVALALYVHSSEGIGPGLIATVIGGLLVWRRFRNQRQRLARRFASKVRKMPEVRIVSLEAMRFTILADQPQARTYVRANAALDAVNGSMFFGDPFTLVVRDAAGPDEEKALLAASGILYVREDAGRPAAG